MIAVLRSSLRGVPLLPKSRKHQKSAHVPEQTHYPLPQGTQLSVAALWRSLSA